MNKTIWAIAFVVLACGVSFAVGNASVTEYDQDKFTGITTAGNITTEGGNITEMDVGTNQSTEKWAGMYGNITGTLVLSEAANAPYMYSWTYDVASGGTVCASTGSNPTWGTIAAITSGVIDAAGAWNFQIADSDSATRTMTNATGVVTLNGVAQPASASLTSIGGWQTVAYGTGGATTKNALAFCVNITSNTAAFNAKTVDFQLMAPANETAAATELYYFFVELS